MRVNMFRVFAFFPLRLHSVRVPFSAPASLPVSILCDHLLQIVEMTLLSFLLTITFCRGEWPSDTY